MTTCWLWIGVALAGPGFYHPTDISLQSERFMKASEQLQAPFGEREAAASRVAVALRQYEAALDLLGDRAPAAERARHAELSKAYNRQFAVLQEFADTLVTDFDDEFTAAMERALAGLGADAAECLAEIPSGPTVPGMGGRTKKNPDCVGDDLNPAVAKALDADAALAVAVDEILGLQWPTIEVDATPQPPVGDGARWLSVHDLLQAGARDAMRSIDHADDEARLKLEARIEQGATTDELRTLTDEADRISGETTARRAALGVPVLAAADETLAKWSKKGEPATAWCANPAALGGCTGDDASRELVGRLLDDKKFAKVLGGG